METVDIPNAEKETINLMSEQQLQASISSSKDIIWRHTLRVEYMEAVLGDKFSDYHKHSGKFYLGGVDSIGRKSINELCSNELLMTI